MGVAIHKPQLIEGQSSIVVRTFALQIGGSFLFMESDCWVFETKRDMLFTTGLLKSCTELVTTFFCCIQCFSNG